MSAGASAAMAAAAAAQANAARVVACKTIVNGYEHKAATVSEAREYASCVSLLHPDPLSPDGVLIAKLIVAVLILSFVGGSVYSFRNLGYGSDLEGALLGALGGLMLSTLGLMAIAGLWFGIGFLFS